ncbi:hypothetical protein BOX15_Mlig032149g5, partial [Macrostomum lignano]
HQPGMTSASSPPDEVELRQVSELRPFHSPGSAIHAGHDGRHVICQRNTSDGSSLFVVDTTDCGIHRELVGQTEKVTAVAVSPADSAVYTANKELLLRRWDWQTGETGSTWRSFHRSPITLLAVSEDGRRLASGSSDGAVRLWDRGNGDTRPCRGHSGLLSLLRLAAGQLFSADGHDYRVRVWSATSAELSGALEGHQSAVTGLCLMDEGWAVTSGRDQVLIVWQLSNYSRLATVPTDESLECCIRAPAGLAESLGLGAVAGGLVLTGGQSGRLKFWDLSSSRRRCLLELSRGDGGQSGGGGGGGESAEYSPGSVQCALTLGDGLLVARQAGSVELYSGSGRLEAEWCGALGEVTCVLAGPPIGDASATRLLLATDSGPFLRVFLWRPGDSADWRCRSLQLHGELDSLICCSLLPGNRLLTAAKGGRVRLHRLEVAGQSLAGVRAVHIGDLEPGHEGHVTALAATADGNMAASACETPVIKAFRVTDSGPTVVAMVTRPHEKAVNCLAVSPNDTLLAAGSRDKSVSLWSLPKLRPIGRLSGHKRGVWSVKFSRHQQLLASVSADCCARVWDLRDLSCHRCLQGDHPLYDLDWLGSQHLVTVDQSGLVRVWSVRDRAPVATREGHNGRAWCIASLGDAAPAADATDEGTSGSGGHWLTGGEDGRLLLWRDATAEAVAERAEARADALAREQRLQNLLGSGRLAEALALALSLAQPSRARGIVADLVAASGCGRLDPELVRGLDEPLQQRLLEFSAGWNSNSRTCHEAQCALHALLLVRTPQQLLAWPSVRRHLPALLAFTERHERRAQQLAACRHLIRLLAADPAA